jgi:hypothetical protein
MGYSSANKTLISPLFATISPFSLFVRLCKVSKLRAYRLSGRRDFDPPRAWAFRPDANAVDPSCVAPPCCAGAIYGVYAVPLHWMSTRLVASCRRTHTKRNYPACRYPRQRARYPLAPSLLRVIALAVLSKFAQSPFPYVVRST